MAQKGCSRGWLPESPRVAVWQAATGKLGTLGLSACQAFSALQVTAAIVHGSKRRPRPHLADARITLVGCSRADAAGTGRARCAVALREEPARQGLEAKADQLILLKEDSLPA